MPRQGPIAKLIGSAVDFTQEYRADREKKKAKEEAASVSQPPAYQDINRFGSYANNQPVSGHNSSEEDLTDDEEWAQDLDEVQLSQRVAATSQPAANLDDLIERFNSRAPLIATPRQSLPMPVILPQRRPESQHRGFVRAYAPVLQDVGIDQETWLEFVGGLEKSIQANGWFHVINGAVFFAGVAFSATAGISVFAHLVSTRLNYLNATRALGYMA
jgi:hypothetical protein